MAKPHFVIKNKFQKKDTSYRDLLTPEILADISLKVTGRSDYTCDFDDTGYNIGRLVELDYEGKKNYISISETDIRSRNSSFQSFPSALARYILEENPNKEISFYFHPSIIGNYETPYFIFMYRLMKTAKIRFLNEGEYLEQPVHPFTTVADIIANKEQIRSKNKGNKSTYVTRGSNNELQIFGKTYGANKYETTILCLALSEIATSRIQLFQIGEGGLTELPEKAREAIESLGKVEIYTSDRAIEKIDFEENDSLRSIEYVYNLLERLGDKKCAFCGCEIPQIIQGAHIWPVSDIKKDSSLSQDEKLACALDGENGLWLCQNHHKLLDANILRISETGTVQYRSAVNVSDMSFLREITKETQLQGRILSEKFMNYLGKRNYSLNESLYC
ncbi:MAG: hypothetical protein A2857_07060 [Candidatus Levybacteria bacterium RIFCSPHIGHO2_01_FULL_36_15]|nr:MAG: hypothetical protein A2857_07060 [Candidatus Levybacteria bacterium RIFCSPHIGHO2_01_FULL_36_15]